jgi:hypothetical protein
MNFIKNYITSKKISSRIEESKKIMAKYNGYIPIIIDQKNSSPKLTEHKFLPLEKSKMKSVVIKMRSYIKFNNKNNSKIYLYALQINESNSNIKRIKLIDTNESCKNVYSKYKHIDGFLYLRYTNHIPNIVENIYNYLKSYFV